jgi:hypothetical protein
MADNTCSGIFIWKEKQAERSRSVSEDDPLEIDAVNDLRTSEDLIMPCV